MKFKKTDELRPLHINESYTKPTDPKGIDAKIKHYKELYNLDEDFEITEENIDDWGVKKCANTFGVSASRMRDELLGKSYQGFDPDNFEVDPDEDFEIEISKTWV